MIWLGHLLLSSIGLLVAGLFALGARWIWRRDASASYRFLVLLLLASLTLPALQWLVQGRAAAESASRFWAKVEAWTGHPETALGTPLTEVTGDWDPALVAEMELLDLDALPPHDEALPSAAPVAMGWWSWWSSRHALTGYLLGVLAFLAWYLVRWSATRRLLRSCQPVQDHVVLETWRKVAGNDPMSRRTSLVQTRRLRSPACWGLLRPTLVLPEGDEEGADPRALEWALRHEQVHLQRGDARVAVLQAVLRTLFWFHPVSWWLSRELDRTRELSCDEQVVKRTGCRKSYALALLDYARSSSAAACPPLLHWTRSPSQLRRRIEMLARRANPLSRRGRWARWMSLCSLVGVLWGGQLSLAAVVFPATQDAGVGQELPPETGSDESAPPATEETLPESVPFLKDIPILSALFRAEQQPEPQGLVRALALQEDQTALLSNRIAALSALGHLAQDSDQEKAELKRKIAELETVLADQRAQLDELRSQLRNTQEGSALRRDEALRVKAEALRQREMAEVARQALMEEAMHQREQSAEGARAVEQLQLLEIRRQEMKARSEQMQAEMKDRQAQLQHELQFALDQGRLDEAKSLEHQLKDTMVEADVRAAELADAMVSIEKKLASQSAKAADQRSRAVALQRQMDEVAMQKELMAKEMALARAAYHERLGETQLALELAAAAGDQAKVDYYQQALSAQGKARYQEAQAWLDAAKAKVHEAERSLAEGPNDVNARLRYQKARDQYDEAASRYQIWVEELKNRNVPQQADDSYRKEYEFYVDLESHLNEEMYEAHRQDAANRDQLLQQYTDLKQQAEQVRAAAEQARAEAVAGNRADLETMVKHLQNQLEALKAAGYTEKHPMVQALRSRYSVTPLPSELPQKKKLPPAKTKAKAKEADAHCSHCDHKPCVEIKIIIQNDGEEPESAPDAEEAPLPKAVSLREPAPISRFLRDF